MTQKKPWIISILLLMVHLAVQYALYAKSASTGQTGSMAFGIDQFVTILILGILGTGLGLLTGLIPFKQKSFLEKFKTTLPISISIVFFLSSVFFGYIAYLKHVRGIELRPLHKYEDIKIPANLDCSTVRNGMFETEELLIERRGSRQTQTNKTTGNKEIFVVEWLHSCEYSLTLAENRSEYLKVKITHVNPNEYGCYVITSKHADDYPNYFTVKRIKSSK